MCCIHFVLRRKSDAANQLDKLRNHSHNSTNTNRPFRLTVFVFRNHGGLEVRLSGWMGPLWKREKKTIIYICSELRYILLLLCLHLIAFERTLRFSSGRGRGKRPPEGQRLFSACSPRVCVDPLTLHTAQRPAFGIFWDIYYCIATGTVQFFPLWDK